MKLNINCVRDTLIALENMSSLEDGLTPKYLSIEDFENNQNTSKYSKKEIVYTLKKLKEGGLIIANFQYADNELYMATITELTYEGHQYLETISNSKIFDMAMNKLDELGSGVTLDILKALCTKLLKEKLGL
uniref:DUF2513 domain-containing protein n=1 Tax=Thomasclavelia spiroformis TaxID=29348 RepID=UPI00359C4BD3